MNTPRFVSSSLRPDAGDTREALRAEELRAWFGAHQAIKGISLPIPERRVTAVIGPSGCGKSTFIRCLNRMHEVVNGARVQGRVLLHGEDIYAAGVNPVALRHDGQRWIAYTMVAPDRCREIRLDGGVRDIQVPAGAADIFLPDVQNLDIGDLALGTAPFEIIGTLTFIAERDGIFEAHGPALRHGLHGAPAAALLVVVGGEDGVCAGPGLLVGQRTPERLRLGTVDDDFAEAFELAPVAAVDQPVVRKAVARDEAERGRRCSGARCGRLGAGAGLGHWRAAGFNP